MYVKALGILLLLAGIITGLWKLYDAGGDAREDKLVREWQAKELKTAKERDEWKAKAEAKVIDHRPVWRERKEKAREIPVMCILPADLIGLLRESGVFTAGEVRDTPNH